MVDQPADNQPNTDHDAQSDGTPGQDANNAPLTTPHLTTVLDKPTSTLDSLNPRHQLFVRAYTDSSASTFGNGTKSALQSGIGKTYMSAAVGASDLLKTTKIRTAITEQLERAGIGSKVRTQLLAEIAKRRRTEVVHYNADGDVTQRQEMDNSKAQLQAIRLAAQIDGDFHRAKEAASMQAKAVAPILETWTRRLRAELARGPTDTPQTLDVDSEAVDVHRGSQDTVEPSNVDPGAVAEPTEGMVSELDGVHGIEGGGVRAGG